MKQMNSEVIYQQHSEIIVRQIAGETLLIPIRNDLADMQKIFSLNPVGEFIWNQIDGKQNLSDIRDKVMAHFDVKADQAISDIKEFIQKLKKANIVEEVNGV